MEQQIHTIQSYQITSSNFYSICQQHIVKHKCNQELLSIHNLDPQVRCWCNLILLYQKCFIYSKDKKINTHLETIQTLIETISWEQLMIRHNLRNKSTVHSLSFQQIQPQIINLRPTCLHHNRGNDSPVIHLT